MSHIISQIAYIFEFDQHIMTMILDNYNDNYDNTYIYIQHCATLIIHDYITFPFALVFFILENLFSYSNW